MRMWLGVPVAHLCQKHLGGAHVESHMLFGCLERGKNIKGFVESGLVEPSCLFAYHEELAAEMIRRGYKHNSEMDDRDFIWREGYPPPPLETRKAYRDKNRLDLAARCPECAARMGVNHNANPDHVLTQEDIDLQRRADLALAEFLRGTEGGQQ